MPKKVNVNMAAFWDAYNEGLTERKIAKKLGLTLKIIMRVFREQKLPPRPKVADLKNVKFGKLTALERHGNNKFGTVIWKCECSCSEKNITYVLSSNLINGTTISCGCAVNDYLGHKPIKHPRYKNLTGRYFNQLERNARKRLLKFDITIQDVWNLYEFQKRKCALSGVDILFTHKNKEQTASVDRKDARLGYTIDNIQIVHKQINRVKWILNNEEFIELCTRVVNHNKT